MAVKTPWGLGSEAVTVAVVEVCSTSRPEAVAPSGSLGPSVSSLLDLAVLRLQLPVLASSASAAEGSLV